MAKRERKRPPCLGCGRQSGHVKGCRLSPENAPTIKGIRILMRGGMPKVDWVIVKRRTKRTVTYLYQNQEYSGPLKDVLIPRHSIDENCCRDIEINARDLQQRLDRLKTSCAELCMKIYGEAIAFPEPEEKG